MGWIPGHLIDGTQAELVRVPFGDNSLYTLPALDLDPNRLGKANSFGATDSVNSADAA